MPFQLTPNEYSELTKHAARPSTAIKDCVMAFLSGGLVCVIGELLTTLYLRGGDIDRELAGTLTSVTLIFVAALLTGLHVFDNIAKYAGAGVLVPITGFSNSVAAPALDFKSEGLVLGLGAKMFTIAGPVIVYGLTTGIVYGILLFLFGLY
ncbi:MAG: stage V sporulation protein AC [Acetanaerobacterium sp.]